MRTSPPAAVVLGSSWGGVCRAHRAAAPAALWVQLRPPVHKHTASKATVECMEHAQVCVCADTHVCACAAVLTDTCELQLMESLHPHQPGGTALERWWGCGWVLIHGPIQLVIY